ncbi:hypothetical protein GCM10010433_27710 [Streptomyces pulveraceus]|uniref:Uncharacterized protein n=1 Tax=Streptomyces pulveraceus TaxID=68258 RepID=A0ABW1GP73_9ACTN
MPGVDHFAAHKRYRGPLDGPTTLMTFWRRSLRAMTDAFGPVGFRINAISKPFPAPGARELFPDLFMDKPSGAFLRLQKLSHTIATRMSSG